MQYSQNPQEREELKGNLDQFTDDLILINKTFNIPGNTKDYGSAHLSNSYGQGNSQRSSAGNKVMSRGPAGEESRQMSKVSGN